METKLFSHCFWKKIKLGNSILTFWKMRCTLILSIFGNSINIICISSKMVLLLLTLRSSRVTQWIIYRGAMDWPARLPVITPLIKHIISLKCRRTTRQTSAKIWEDFKAGFYYGLANNGAQFDKIHVLFIHF